MILIRLIKYHILNGGHYFMRYPYTSKPWSKLPPPLSATLAVRMVQQKGELQRKPINDGVGRVKFINQAWTNTFIMSRRLKDESGFHPKMSIKQDSMRVSSIKWHVHDAD